MARTSNAYIYILPVSQALPFPSRWKATTSEKVFHTKSTWYQVAHTPPDTDDKNFYRVFIMTRGSPGLNLVCIAQLLRLMSSK